MVQKLSQKRIGYGDRIRSIPAHFSSVCALPSVGTLLISLNPFYHFCDPVTQTLDASLVCAYVHLRLLQRNVLGLLDSWGA